MQTYKLPGLTSMTSDSDQSKLAAALEGVPGVSSVTLCPDTSEFEIKASKEQKPKRADVTAAAAEAGFTVSDKKKS